MSNRWVVSDVWVGVNMSMWSFEVRDPPRIRDKQPEPYYFRRNMISMIVNILSMIALKLEIMKRCT